MANVLVVFPRIEDAKSIRNLLKKFGFQVTGVFTAGAQVLKQASDIQSGIVVCGYRLADMVSTDLMESLPETFKMVLMTAKCPPEGHCAQGIAVIRMPARPQELIETVNRLEEQLAAERRKRRMHPKIRSRQEQEIIARAKQLLREEKNMEEPEAHRYLQQRSMENGTGLVETAEMVLRLGRL